MHVHVARLVLRQCVGGVFVSELADLWFHSLVVMAYHNVSIGDVALELERREGVSGLEEKASRKK